MTATDPRPNVLVVDDERGPRESLRMILEPAHRVHPSSRGSEALEVLRSRPIDVVMLDLHMPGMKGDELMRAVRREFPRVEIIVVTGCASVESAAEAVRHGICDYLQKPFDVVQVTAAVARAVARRRARGGDAPAPAAPQGFEFLELLAGTIEANDPFLRGHARRVAFYAGILGERLGLGPDARESLRLSAFLHDLGKVGVPTDLLQRGGPLDPHERRIVERHPVIGARLLAPLDLPSGVVLALRHHHEWWDGGGYPDAIAGAHIPLAARIIGVTDAFDAMTSDRPYRRALPRQVAVAELRRFSGTQFDPEIAREFLACVESGLCDANPAQTSGAAALRAA